jgi:hypothetical protein
VSAVDWSQDKNKMKANFVGAVILCGKYGIDKEL